MKRYMLLLGILLCAAACESDPTPAISVEKTEYEVASNYTELNIPVQCNVPSSAKIRYEGESGWITLLPSVLKGNGVYSCWIKQYDNVMDDRVATLVITAGDALEQEVKITQLSKTSITVKPMNLATTRSSGEFEIEVACKRAWELKVEDDAKDWCKALSDHGEGPAKVRLQLGELPDNVLKTGHITVKSGDLELTMSVQHGYARKLGDIVWAKANVATNGMFCERMDDRGGMFQHSSNVAWPNPGKEEQSKPDGMRVGQYDNGMDDWLRENDPCPEGWRIPTLDQVISMFGQDEPRNVSWKEPDASGFAVAGSFVGVPTSVGQNASKDDLKGSIFLPQAGSRNKDDGFMWNWWDATLTTRTRPGQNWDRFIFWTNYTNASGWWADGNAAAYPVRCVAVQE